MHRRHFGKAGDQSTLGRTARIDDLSPEEFSRPLGRAGCEKGDAPDFFLRPVRYGFQNAF